MPYVYAGGETLFPLLYEKFYLKFGKYFLAPYSQTINNKVLITFGTNLGKAGKNKSLKTRGKYTNRFIKFFQRPEMKFPLFLINKNLFNLYIDSGGFQATRGYLSDTELFEFIDEYTFFLENYKDIYSWAFTLDLLLLKGKYSEYENMLKLNMHSFEKLSELPKEVKDKLLFIYHFRTPELFHTWIKISNEFESQFSNYYAAGGLVATSDDRFPIRSYAVPIVFAVRSAIKRNLKDIKLHFLGGSAYTDVLMYSFYRKIVKQKFDINLEITYDSSSAFKQIEMARVMPILFEGITYLISLKEKELDSPNEFIRTLTNRQLLDHGIKEMLDFMGASEFYQIYKSEEIYKDGAFNRTASIFPKMYLGYLYLKLEEYGNKISENFTYDENDLFGYTDIYNNLTHFFSKINKGKLTRNIKKKLHLSTTFKIISNLDIDYITHIIENM